jgi:hypothetical protein
MSAVDAKLKVYGIEHLRSVLRALSSVAGLGLDPESDPDFWDLAQHRTNMSVAGRVALVTPPTLEIAI